MSVAARLGGFTVVLALVFAAAAFAGSRIDAHPGRQADPRADEPAMGAMRARAEMAPQPVRGLAVSDDGLTLRLARAAATPGKPFELAFRIVDRRGQTVRDFDVEHTKRMHFIVVRRDMTGFQHLHPTQAADGTWSVPVTLRDAGLLPRVRRLLRERQAAHAGRRPRRRRHRALAGAARAGRSMDVDGLRVQLTEGASRAGAESRLAFDVTRDGKPVAVEQYLGAKGHLVALRQGDLAFLHVHPDESSLRFMAAFPTAGRYRLFLQFKTDGRIHTAAFTQEVSR